MKHDEWSTTSHGILGADMDPWAAEKKNLFCLTHPLGVATSLRLQAHLISYRAVSLASRRFYWHRRARPTTLPLECPNMTSTLARLPSTGEAKLASARWDRDRAVCSGPSEASPAFSVRATCARSSESQTRLAHVDGSALAFQ
jgi:hypothetical protein